MAYRMLIDLNVIIDVLARRVPFDVDSSELLAAAQLGLIEGYAAAHSLTTLHYLMVKRLTAVVAQAQIVQLLSFLTVAPVDGDVIKRALALASTDFEDAVQMAAAVQIGADYVVSRNLTGFKTGPVPVVTPVEAIVLLQNAAN